MKHILTTTTLTLLTTVAHAGWIESGATLCITEHMAKTYQTQAEAGQDDFNQDLLDRAACYHKKGGTKALLMDTSGNLVKVKLPDSHTVWAQKEVYSDAMPAPKVAPEPESNHQPEKNITVAEKPTWYSKIKAFFTWED